MDELKNRSVAYLLHPVTLFAYTILFINDHFIKYYYPNWISGKISDVAWVFIFPGVLAFILSLLSINSHVVTARKVWYRCNYFYNSWIHLCKIIYTCPGWG